MHRTTGVIATTLTVAACGLAAAAPAQAARTTKPSAVPAATRAAIARAATHTPLLGAVKPSAVRVSQIRVTRDGRYASALDTPRDGSADPAQVLLVRRAGRWVATDLGTDGVGCGIVPQRTRTQLHLAGTC